MPDFLNCPRFYRLWCPFYDSLPQDCSRAFWPVFLAAIILIPATTLQALPCVFIPRECFLAAGTPLSVLTQLAFLLGSGGIGAIGGGVVIGLLCMVRLRRRRGALLIIAFILLAMVGANCLCAFSQAAAPHQFQVTLGKRR
jgi:hypothetical protein